MQYGQDMRQRVKFRKFYCLSAKHCRAGAHLTYAHARILRETPIYATFVPFCPLLYELEESEVSICGVYRQPRAGDASSLALGSIYT